VPRPAAIKRKPLPTLQQETQQQQNLLLKLRALQPIALLRQPQPLKAQPTGRWQQQMKHSLAATRTAIAWNACSKGLRLSS
jgi:hypothetical protein